MQRTLLVLTGFFFVGIAYSQAAPPLEADGMRSVLIRGRVIAPVIPAVPAQEAEVSLTIPDVVPVPSIRTAGPEPTPAAPRMMPPPGGGRPATRALGSPSPLRGAANRSDTEASRLAGTDVTANQDKGRDPDSDHRPRGGFLRRRR